MLEMESLMNCSVKSEPTDDVPHQFEYVQVKKELNLEENYVDSLDGDSSFTLVNVKKENIENEEQKYDISEQKYVRECKYENKSSTEQNMKHSKHKSEIDEKMEITDNTVQSEQFKNRKKRPYNRKGGIKSPKYLRRLEQQKRSLNKNIQCVFCPKVVTRKVNYEHHLLKDHREHINHNIKQFITSKIHKCNNCSFETTLKSYLDIHINSFHNENRTKLNCQFCDKTFVKKESVDDHLLKHHKDQIGESTEKLITSKIHKCNVCSYETTEKSSLTLHFNAMHNEHRLKINCQFCDRSFTKQVTLDDHVLKQHKNDIKIDVESFISSKIHKCSLCSYETTNKSVLDGHVSRIHNEDKSRLKCPFCDKSFAMKYTLDGHLIREHNEETKTDMEGLITSKIHLCHVCSYATTDRNYLDKHIKSVHEEKKKCDFCDKAFAIKRSLDNHLLKQHKQELQSGLDGLISSKIYRCKLCAYETTLKTCLTTHSVTHNNDTKNVSQLACPFCGKAFVIKRTYEDHCLKKHRSQIVDNLEHFVTSKIHICNMSESCSYETVFKSSLDTHVKLMHNEVQLRLNCLFCSKSFRGEYTRDDHLLKHHPNEIKDNKSEFVTSKIHACNVCSYETTSKTRLEVHLKAHLKKKN